MYRVLIDDITYGPVPATTLLSWATMGRLHGDHIISKNNSDLREKAETFTELGLTWQIKSNDGHESYLLNPVGVKELTESGMILHDTNVFDKQTRQTLSLQDALSTLRGRTAVAH